MDLESKKIAPIRDSKTSPNIFKECSYKGSRLIYPNSYSLSSSALLKISSPSSISMLSSPPAPSSFLIKA
jgi:hypothetical protein